MAFIPNALSSILGSSETWNWFEHIRPASFRGIPFAVVDAEGVFGRRQAVHEYPYRNTAWVEDLGRGTRKITLRGFIVHNSLAYDAPDVITQRNSLVAACEMQGPGTLIHPTLGELTVSVPDGGLRVFESADSGRSFEFSLTLLESGLKVFAVTGNADSVSIVQENRLRTGVMAAAKFIATVKGEARSVVRSLRTLRETATFWGNLVRNSVSEVTNLSSALNATFGSQRYGRYSRGTVGGAISGSTGVVDRSDDTRDYAGLVHQKMAEAVQGRSQLLSITERFERVTSVEAFPTDAMAVIDALISLSGSVDEKIRMLITLASFQNAGVYVVSDGQAVAGSAVILLRVLAAGALAITAAEYEPASYDDAVSMLNRICDTLDEVLLATADAGDDDDYNNLLKTRDALVVAYNQKGTALSSLTQVVMPVSLPALTLANRLYQDGERGDELIQSANPRHPAFMPVKFKALRN